jgi:hypothetical protein
MNSRRKENMKEQYEPLEMETIEFESEDVITTSGEDTNPWPV